MNKTYDVIIVGARCAGAPTAMLLARKGYRVLVTDRAIPRERTSSEILHPPAVAALARWGLLDRLIATGCPPVHTYAFDFGSLSISGSPGTEESPVAYCPRRSVLDRLLVEGALEAGAEVREGFTVEDIMTDERRVYGIRGSLHEGARMTALGTVIVGADGRHSFVASALRPEQYGDRPPLLSWGSSTWSGLPMGGRFERYLRPGRGFWAAPTHDDLTLVTAAWPHAGVEENEDAEGSYLSALQAVPEFAQRLRGARREERVASAAAPNYLRKPYGPGWVLVGDAGHSTDPIAAQGVTDAFLDAERLVNALDDFFADRRSFDDAMAGYHRARDEYALPLHEFTCQLAALEPLPPERQRVLEAIRGKQEAMDQFVRVSAGGGSPAQFFSEAGANLGR